MRLLVDSDVLLWHLSDDPRLGPKAAAAPNAEVLVSAASLWELAIKVGLGRLRAPHDLPERIQLLADDTLHRILATA